eukprot:c25152_g3_i1 orf=653-1666(+)
MDFMGMVQATIFMVFLGHLAYVCAEDDSNCLKEFRSSVHDPYNYLSNWDFTNATTASLCSFVGVTCWNQRENRVLSLKLEQAGLSGSFPKGLNLCASLQGLSLAGNSFSGPVPDNISKQMQYLTSLDLSQNFFSGSIPGNLANCSYLNMLHLQKNKLTGDIPWGIGVLSRLTDLDLSSNLLNGFIPSSFTNRTSINQQPFGASAFANNPGLCGPPLSTKCGESPKPKVAIYVGAVAAAAVFALICGFIVWWVLLRSGKKANAYRRDEHKWAKLIRAPQSVTVSMFQNSLMRLKLSDLMAATNDFGKENIIALGRTGTVYKATMPDGSTLAIKRLQMS